MGFLFGEKGGHDQTHHAMAWHGRAGSVRFDSGLFWLSGERTPAALSRLFGNNATPVGASINKLA